MQQPRKPRSWRAPPDFVDDIELWWLAVDEVCQLLGEATSHDSYERTQSEVDEAFALAELRSGGQSSSAIYALTREAERRLTTFAAAQRNCGYSVAQLMDIGAEHLANDFQPGDDVTIFKDEERARWVIINNTKDITHFINR
jgi:hypothetical protein